MANNDYDEFGQPVGEEVEENDGMPQDLKDAAKDRLQDEGEKIFSKKNAEKGKEEGEKEPGKETDNKKVEPGEKGIENAEKTGAKKAGKETGEEVGGQAAKEAGKQAGKEVAEEGAKTAVKTGAAAATKVGTAAGIEAAGAAAAPETLGWSLVVSTAISAAIGAFIDWLDKHGVFEFIWHLFLGLITLLAIIVIGMILFFSMGLFGNDSSGGRGKTPNSPVRADNIEHYQDVLDLLAKAGSPEEKIKLLQLKQELFNKRIDGINSIYKNDTSANATKIKTLTKEISKLGSEIIALGKALPVKVDPLDDNKQDKENEKKQKEKAMEMSDKIKELLKLINSCDGLSMPTPNKYGLVNYVESPYYTTFATGNSGMKWGKPRVYCALHKIAQEWLALGQGKLKIGNIGDQWGDNSGHHQSHTDGIYVDIWAKGTTKYQETSDETYNYAASKQLIDILKRNGVVYMIVSYSDLGEDSNAIHWHHWHIQF
jgi:hypothetical protein